MSEKETNESEKPLSETESASVSEEVEGEEIEESTQNTPLTAYDVFNRCILRAENLIEINTESEGEDLKDAYRAAIVLSISALDAFIRTLLIREIRNIIADTSQDLSGHLKDYLKELLNQDILIQAARENDLLDRVERAIKDDFETKSFQGEWKINKFMKFIGHDNIFRKASIKANVNERNLRAKLEKYTNRRHIIAHSGDYALNQTPVAENDIEKEEALECVEVVKLFAENINILVREDE